ncbi:hypothetical protein A3D85_01030 [Candidatus Amesbacteria bacterium RIFCSPHIGHO2_02_FULL_47_9]|uniref:Uncharacterized protein n=1 Tax=Candidatus Amesbacteria bacterium RIFCSPHIGHO2_01_FULL_48_32b TaxID=1797253 RepID=A0A1F4YH37_9BACT|nr:MAG: hypothetical protein A2876_04810 [Candidatus Amesbacteria bacterium RIFCSPHIGHO2_01_FULL_48_32b]OGD04628.1 MAG: hypothetical protein A3D85_01030 [Candidatus Amesbacteria bacterium RIFCSPHIGHO2_02_FULL_47_9]OGD07016.1 MAG: hypothetical protein A2899_00065 [Candidatus Amesbacteria bacterium RIFCSPLOWO2_01_FULL_49_25]
MQNKILKFILVLDLMAVNTLVGYLVYRSLLGITKTEVTSVDRCGEECRAEIKNQLAGLQVGSDNGGTVVVLPTPTPTLKPVVQPAVKKVRREEILTIPGSGSTSLREWTNLSGTEFYFDTRDYPGLIEVYFEANLKLQNGNGTAYVRLFDITNSIAPAGAQNDTESQADVWTKSQKVFFWAGKNLIRVQAKSLTADTTVYSQGRLRIVTEN